MFKVGNDRRVSFWKDRRNGDESLEEAFLKLFSITSVKDAWVDQLWEQIKGGCWKPLFIRQNNH